MIEKTILNYLSDNLSAAVYMEVPENAPNRFVVLEKTGSGTKNRLYSATFAIQSYEATLLGAAELNEEVKTAMASLQGESAICAATLNSDYNFTDTASKKYRYQAVFDIVHY